MKDKNSLASKLTQYLFLILGFFICALTSCKQDDDSWKNMSGIDPNFNGIEYFRMKRNQIWEFDAVKLSADYKDTLKKGIERWYINDTIFQNGYGENTFTCKEVNIDSHERLSYYSFSAAFQRIRFSYNKERIVLIAFDANKLDGTLDFNCENTSDLQTCYAKFPVRSISNGDTTFQYHVDINRRISKEQRLVKRRLSLVKEQGPVREHELRINKITGDTIVFVKRLNKIIK